MVNELNASGLLSCTDSTEPPLLLSTRRHCRWDSIRLDSMANGLITPAKISTKHGAFLAPP